MIKCVVAIFYGQGNVTGNKARARVNVKTEGGYGATFVPSSTLPQSTLYLLSTITQIKMPGFRIPILTEEGLREYHRRHLPSSRVPPGPLLQYSSTQSIPQEIDVLQKPSKQHLGYYSDGKKRTITDEQIAIFRHSEIQQMIRDVRSAAEEGLLPRQQEGFRKDGTQPDAGSSNLLDDVMSVSSGEEMDISSDAEETKPSPSIVNATSPPQFRLPAHTLEKRKWTAKESNFNVFKQRKNSYYHQRPRAPVIGVRNNPEDFQNEEGGQTYRRQCREADEVKTDPVELDY
jgi:hypothetical protein